jgi:tRNA uracil 4-sulfurtransferase
MKSNIESRPCLLLRCGELTLKSRRKRPFFERLYCQTIAKALSANGVKEFTLENRGGFYILYHEQAQDILNILLRISGIQKISLAECFDFNGVEDLISKVIPMVKEDVANASYAVRARRIDNNECSAASLSIEIGTLLSTESNHVDLKNPEVTVSVEVRNRDVYVFTETYEGIGGLPIDGTQRALCMFSGGIDSPVAAYQMLKRGCALDFFIVNLVGEKGFWQAARVYNYLISQYTHGYKPKLFVLDGTSLVDFLQKNTNDRMRQLALKIAFYKLGEKVAKENSLKAIVTGEALSQKSTQTLSSLSFIEGYSDIPVLRPLIGFDKVEVMAIAEKIGTFASSKRVKEYCNLANGPVIATPRTSHDKFIPNFDEIVEELYQKIEVHEGIIDIQEEECGLDKDTFHKPLEIVDARSKLSQKMFEYDVDHVISFPEILDQLSTFSNEKKYLIFCEFGVRSEEAAYQLRKKGIQASGISLKNYRKFFENYKSADVALV